MTDAEPSKADVIAPAPAPAATSSSGPPVVINDKIPSGQVNLRLLLVSGKKSDVLVLPSDTVEAVRKKVFDSWPKEWSEEAPDAPPNIRILFQGRILEPNTTIEANKIPTNQTTVVHALIRNGPVTEVAGEDKPKTEEESRGCGCCIIL